MKIGERCTVGCPTCGGLINEAFSCHQAAWLRRLRRLDNLRYIARRLFILSGRRSRHERLLRKGRANRQFAQSSRKAASKESRQTASLPYSRAALFIVSR